MQIVVYFVGALFLLVLAFVVFRVFVLRDYRRRKRLTWFTILLELLIFVLHANFSYLYLPAEWPDMPPLPDNTLLRYAGLFIIAVGLTVMFAGMVGLGLRRLFGQEVKEVKQTGLYGITRNPQLLAYGLAVIGYAILWPSWYALGWVVLYGAIAHMMVLTEEEHLRDVGGEAYARYCERVPRYLPSTVCPSGKDGGDKPMQSSTAHHNHVLGGWFATLKPACEIEFEVMGAI